MTVLSVESMMSQEPAHSRPSVIGQERPAIKGRFHAVSVPDICVEEVAEDPSKKMAKETREVRIIYQIEN